MNNVESISLKHLDRPYARHENAELERHSQGLFWVENGSYEMIPCIQMHSKYLNTKRHNPCQPLQNDSRTFVGNDN